MMISFHLARRISSLLLIGAMLLAAAGCSTGRTSSPFKTVELPEEGGPLDTAIWAEIEKAEEEGVPAPRTMAEKYCRGECLNRLWKFKFWLLPLNLYNHAFCAREGAQEISDMRIMYNDLGLPLLLMLPVHVYTSEYAYDRENPEPVAETRLRWTPWWVWATNEGDRPRASMETQGGGSPLFYSKTKFTYKTECRGELNVMYWNTLYILGPALMDASVSDKFMVGEPGGSAKMFAPIGLPFLGPILWSHRWTRFESLNAFEVTYGIFGGWLGYRAVKYVPSEEGNSLRVNHLLSGLLWQDRTRTDRDGEIRASSHGPLWGMLGWGSRGDHKKIYLFWVPI